MKLDFFNVDEFCKNLKPITEAKIYSKDSTFAQNGLFSQAIFGPIRTATCSCQGGTYWGRARIGHTCQTCGVDIAYASERRKRFSRIELPFPILNPIMYHLLVKAGKTKMKDILDKLLMDDKTYGYYYDKEQERFVHVERIVKERESDEEEEPEIPEDVELFKGVEGLHNIVMLCCEKFKDKDPLWAFIADNIDKFYMSNVIVPPPEFRPVSKTKDAQMRDEMNKYFMTILNYSLTLGGDNLDTENLEGISQISFKDLQKHVFELYEYIFKKFSKKSGLIRGSILGKRIDFSARAVICPDPKLKLGECSLPYNMVLELYKLEIANVLLEKRVYKRYDSAIKYIDKCIELEDKALLGIVNEVLEGQFVILNRQPTLHRMGLFAFIPKVNTDYVIKIHPLCCEPYNADFDGDQMAVYRPLYDNTIKECDEKLNILSNLLCPTTGGLVLGVNQDVVLGLYLLTRETEGQEMKHEGIDTYKGRVVFNKCLPDEYPFINKTITKKLLRVILDDVGRTHASDVTAKTLDAIKDLGLRFTTMTGVTMSLKDMHIANAKELTDPIFDSDKSISEKISLLQGKEVMDAVKKSFPYSVFIDSGSRGSWDQANQIILSRGYVSNFAGEVKEDPVKSNLMHGLTRQEFFTSCYGSRKGLLDTACNTGVSGYLTRKLIYCTSNLELDLDLEDCGSDYQLSIEIDNDANGVKIARSLIGRWVKTSDDPDTEHVITYHNYQDFLGKIVLVRSPIFCKSNSICKKCYGETSDILHSKYVGIIAAQALGEVSTQMVLRTFHTSGVAQKREDGASSKEQEDIVDDLSLVKKIFHNSTPFTIYGEKIDKLTYSEALRYLHRIYNRYKNILMVHHECIISQMMRVGDKRWRMTKERDLSEYKLVSIESVPSKESWLLALAFSRPKQYLVDGILGDDLDDAGILEKIMMNDDL